MWYLLVLAVFLTGCVLGICAMLHFIRRKEEIATEKQESIGTYFRIFGITAIGNGIWFLMATILTQGKSLVVFVFVCLFIEKDYDFKELHVKS